VLVEALCAHGRHLAEAVLDLVGDRQGGEKRVPVGLRVLGCRQHRREVVARVAGLARGEIGVVEVQVAHERAVVERGAVRRSLSTADQRRQWLSAEFVHLLADHRHRSAVERAECHAERVEYTQLQLLARRLGDALPARATHEFREVFDLGRRSMACASGAGQLRCAGVHCSVSAPRDQRSYVATSANARRAGY
jgi:hypothetical protein